MSEDVIATVKRFATDYRRGSHTDTEFVDLIFRTLVDHNVSEDIVNQTLVLVPDSAIPALEDRMHEMVERDFFVPNTYLGDTRSDDEIRRDSYARQSVLKRIHHAFLRPLLIRRYRLEHGW
jgi:hypothetical protein